MLIDSLLSVLAPHECLNCLAEGRLACSDCRTALERPDIRCYKCHKPGSSMRTCTACQASAPLASLQSATRYVGLGKELVHALKFGRAQAAASEIADIIAGRLGLDRHMAAYDGIVIVHVPTATSRVRQRGYDQSQLIARALSKRSGIPYRQLLLRRGQLQQVGKVKAVRRQQLQAAFRPVHLVRIRGARVLLVDDVATTGSTLEAAATTLLQAGAARVEGIVFARA